MGEADPRRTWRRRSRVWSDRHPGLPPTGLKQIALLLTGTARAVAAGARRAADLPPETHAARVLANVGCEDTGGVCPFPRRAPRAAHRATPGSYAPCSRSRF